MRKITGKSIIQKKKQIQFRKKERNKNNHERY